MTDEQLKTLKSELDEIDLAGMVIDEVRALRKNMKSTQERCTELLEENRRLKREKKMLEASVAHLEAECKSLEDAYDTIENNSRTDNRIVLCGAI